MIAKHRAIPATLTGLALALSGCAAQEADTFDDPEAIADELERENGGLDMEDEAPLFGDDALFAEPSVDTPFADPIDRDAEVVAMRDAPGAALYNVALMWGQLPADADVEVAFDWTGEISVSRGALIVRSVLAFEGRTDTVEPRTDRRVVRIRSATRPGRDGLELVVIDPTPEAPEAISLTYTSAGGAVFTATLADLVAGPRSAGFDDAGNRMVGVAYRRPVDACEHGFLRGRWHKVADERGRLVGHVLNADGQTVGHMRGVYGQRLNGDQVFFGKFIDRSGRFRGIFRGTYGGGEFIGRWMTRDGDVGGLGGDYRETRPGPRVGGHFLGRWAETRCERDGRP